MGRKPGIIVLPSRVWEAQDEANDSEMSALDRERRQTNHSGCEVCFPAAQQRVLLAVQMAAWVVILGEFIIMSICLDYSWFGEIVVIWYFILLITDSKHLLSVMQCVLSWIAAAAFTVIIFAHEMALW